MRLKVKILKHWSADGLVVKVMLHVICPHVGRAGLNPACGHFFSILVPDEEKQNRENTLFTLFLLEEKNKEQRGKPNLDQ